MRTISKYKVVYNKNAKKKYIVPLIVLTCTLLLTFIFLTRKTITVVVDGKERRIVTYKNTVKKVLEDNEILVGSKDKISSALEAKLVNKEVINIKKAVNVKVLVDGKELPIESAEDNVGLMLKAEKITLGSEDRVEPEKEAKLSDGMEIKIVRVETKTVEEKVPVGFNTVVKKSSSMPNNQRKTTQAGKNGEKKVTYSVVCENGKEVSRKVTSETVVSNPVDEIILQGTYPLMPVNKNGEALPYSKVFKARATAYYAVHGVGSTYTASGRKAVRNADGYSTIAVDRSIIPLGTKLFVEGYGFAIAADVGTAIVGNNIDVYFNTYKEACNWAVRYVNVYVLK